MFIDASALCAMIAAEREAEDLFTRLQSAEVRVTSPLAIWETAVNLPRLVGVTDETAEEIVMKFLSLMGIVVVPVEPETTTISLEAFRRYGKGRHPAALNFADCFAYACAKHHKLPLLFKGNDFLLTDIESA